MLSRLRSRTIVTYGCAISLAILVTTSAIAEDVFYSLPIKDLKFTQGKLPSDTDAARPSRVHWMIYRNMSPYAVLDGEGEAYVHLLNGQNPWMAPAQRAAQANIVIRVPAPRKITGMLMWPKPDWSGHEQLKFVLDSEGSSEAKTAFTAAKQLHYLDLMGRGIAGTAWFRHQVRQTRASQGQTGDGAPRVFGNRNRIDGLEDTFDLFSGGKAISENLQLDRVLQPVATGQEMVPLDSLKGISTAEIDWKPLLKEMQPALDPLAKLVPADQHVVLFPSFSAFVRVGDRLSEHGTIVMRLAEPQSNNPRLVERYEQQLCLSIKGLGRIVGSLVVGSVALTGSDPYFVTGTDVALVFESTKPELLKNLLLAQIAVNAQQTRSAKKVTGEINGLSYSGMRSPDRRVSSYVTVLPGAVVLTNSPYQLERFAAVVDKAAPPIASLDEFAFFRDRYRRADQDESALVFLSDATIRRWCGPRWRIATSRQTRDAAVLAELQAINMNKLVKQEIETGPVHTDLPLACGGELTLSRDGVRSSQLGSLDFMTPIAELKFNEVTKAEADAYNRWRDGYQSNWSWAFDPIALRLGVTDTRLSADLTVMPLIARSEYRQMIAVSRGAVIAPNAGDRHQALVQVIFALNTKSEMVRGAGGMLAQMVPGARLDPLGWLGQSISLYADEDPFWNELAGCKTDKERERFVERNARRIPVALWAEVSSGFKLTAFLSGVRAFIEQTAPGMTNWESLEYRDQPYVKITPTERALPAREDEEQIKAQLFYVASGKFLLVTPSEALLKRALDRQAALDSAKKDPAKKNNQKGTVKSDAATDLAASTKPREPQPWLGSNLGLQVDHKLLPMLATVFGEQYQQWMQSQSWNNLPILNEWHRLYPDEDPLALHERIWHERLVCPGGGKYVWNHAWQTMASTVYGNPGQPKTGPVAPPELLNFRFANFGVTFEEQGLRARVTVDRESPHREATKSPRP